MHSACHCASQTRRIHSISHAKLAPGWVLLQVDCYPKLVQEIGLKVEDGRSFTGLQYLVHHLVLHNALIL